MTTDKLRSAFFYHRSKGRPASSAIIFARGDVAVGRDRHAYSYPKPLNQGWGNARADDGSVWIEDLSAAGLRLVDYADKLAKLGHTGWYTSDDNELGESLRGVVVHMAARNGSPRYLAGYEDPNNPGSYRLDASEIFAGNTVQPWQTPEHDAALAADSFAERSAEQERDYNRAWQAGRRFEDLAEEVATTRRSLLSLIMEAKATCKAGRLGPALRAAIGDKITDGLNAIRKARAKRARLFDDLAARPVGRVEP